MRKNRIIAGGAVLAAAGIFSLAKPIVSYANNVKLIPEQTAEAKKGTEQEEDGKESVSGNAALYEDVPEYTEAKDLNMVLINCKTNEVKEVPAAEYMKSVTGDEKPSKITLKEHVEKYGPLVNHILNEDGPDAEELWDAKDVFVEAYARGDERFAVIRSEEETKHILREEENFHKPYCYWKAEEQGSYRYQLNGLKKFVITDFYMTCGEDGTLAVSLANLDSAGKNIRVSLYEYSTGLVVDSWTGNPQETEGLKWNKLNPHWFYYVVIEADEAESVSGTGWIFGE